MQPVDLSASGYQSQKSISKDKNPFAGGKPADITSYYDPLSARFGPDVEIPEMTLASSATEYYRKCLRLMPDMGPAKDWIEKLEAEE